MTLREMPWIALRTAAGACALFVSIHGLWNIYGLDFRIDTLTSVLYCLLPFLSFFIFLFVKRAKPEITLHALIAIGYLAAYVFLNWRTCTAFGDCSSIGTTISTTLRTWPIVAAFAVVLFSGITLFGDRGPAPKAESRPAN